MGGKEFRLPRSASMPHAPGLLATLVRDGFADYHARFAAITRSATMQSSASNADDHHDSL